MKTKLNTILTSCRLDDKFRLTGKVIAREGDLARGVWHYAQGLCGVYSDDFNYSSSQKLLQGGLQQQLEKACRGNPITPYNSSISSSCNTWNNHSSLDTHFHQTKLSTSKKGNGGFGGSGGEITIR